MSRTTVSRVLNGSSKVRESTRERILAEVARLNYTPHHAARALATRRTRTIGAVLPTIESSIPARFIGGLESTLRRHGYALVTATTGFDQAVEAQHGRDLIGLGAEALVVLGLEHDEALLRAAQSRGVPIVCAGVFDPDFPLPTIGWDNRSLGATAMHFFLDRGHEHIAVASGPLRRSDRRRMRLAGMRDAYPDHSKLLSRGDGRIGRRRRSRGPQARNDEAPADRIAVPERRPRHGRIVRGAKTGFERPGRPVGNGLR